MTQQQSTASIVLCLLVMVFMVHWSCTQAESSLVAQSSSANWETDTIPTSQSKSSLSTNLNDISDRLYRIIYKRLADTTASVDPYGDLDDVDRFNRQERHLRFGKRFSSRAKYSDLDYGHMRFGRR
ncbi:hypothetical protein DERF_006913 [Dermatophagoides farinae]|uniref:Uncharacterized protein n=1 Tax=Dermatophagoides farinae TaxID=6954 RepID=A0A922HY16_DERFA|nr:hypothetical protein DERF_006913 [Dermatophagoides farinae]